MSPQKRKLVAVEVSDAGAGAIAIACISVFLACAAAWITHVVWIIGKLAGPAGVTGCQLLLGFLGSFIPPVGIVHGVMIWFGAGY